MARYTLLTLLAALAAHQVAAAPVVPKDADLSITLPTSLDISTVSITLPSITIPTDISTISLPTGLSVSIPTTLSLPTLSTSLLMQRRDTPIGTATGAPSGLPLPPLFSGFPHGPHPTGSGPPPTGPAPTGPAPTGAPRYPGGLLHPGRN